MAYAIAESKSPGEFTLFAVPVATASARDTSFEITVAASALPKLSECPTVPDEVQTPVGVSSG